MSGQVRLAELTPDRFADAAAWLGDAENQRWLTAEWRGRKVDGSVIAIAKRNRRNVLRVIEQEGVPCGVVAFGEWEPADRSAMVWYVLGDRSRSGRGVTTAAVRLLCEEGFGPMGLRCIWATVLSPNAASLRVLEKVGFRRAGHLRDAECVEGRQFDRMYLDLLPGEIRPPTSSQG